MKWRVWQVRIAVTAMLTAMPLSVMAAVLTIWTAHTPLTVPTFLHAVAISVLLNPIWWLGVGFTVCDPLLRWRSASVWYLVTPVGTLVAAAIASGTKVFGLPGAIAWIAGSVIAFCCLLVQSWIVVDMPETTVRHTFSVTPVLFPAVVGSGPEARIIPFDRSPRRRSSHSSSDVGSRVKPISAQGIQR